MAAYRERIEKIEDNSTCLLYLNELKGAFNSEGENYSSSIPKVPLNMVSVLKK
jgi:hypothetical protein